MHRLEKEHGLRGPVSPGPFGMLLVLLALLFGTPLSSCADQANDKQVVRKIQAGFIYNFIRFTTWPDSSLKAEAPLVVAIIGDSSSAETLRRELDDKKYGNHPIISKIIEPEGSLDGVHIVFLLKKSSLSPAELVKRIGRRPILSIGEAENFLQSGGMIRLFLSDDTIHFTLNVRAARESDIALSSQLGSMADTDQP